MAVSYTDTEVDGLLRERKRLPQDWEHRTRLKAKRGHREQYLELTGDAGTRFRLILRQSRINGLDFSIILAVLVPQSTQVFRLCRYNGRSHEHTNQIENQVFYDFHIHFATERLPGARGARGRVRSANGSVRNVPRCARLSLQGRQLQRFAEGARRTVRPCGRSEMTVESVERSFREKVSAQVRLAAEGVDRFRVFTPFLFDDGDHLAIVLRREGAAWVLSDEAHTYMHLSYDIDEKDLHRGTRQKIIANALSMFRIEDRDGELVLGVRDAGYGDALYSFIQGTAPDRRRVVPVAGKGEVDLHGRFPDAVERDDCRRSAWTFDWNDPTHDPHGMYAVDCRVNGMARPLFVHALGNDGRTRDATIALLQFEKWGIAFRSLAIFEDQEVNQPESAGTPQRRVREAVLQLDGEPGPHYTAFLTEAISRLTRTRSERQGATGLPAPFRFAARRSSVSCALPARGVSPKSAPASCPALPRAWAKRAADRLVGRLDAARRGRAPLPEEIVEGGLGVVPGSSSGPGSIGFTAWLARVLTSSNTAHSGDQSFNRSARSGTGSSETTRAFRMPPSSPPFAARSSSSSSVPANSVRGRPPGRSCVSVAHVVADRHQHGLLRLLPLPEVERDQRPDVAAPRRAAREELRVVDVPEGAVQGALQPLHVGGEVLAHGDPPLGAGRPGAVEVQVGGVEDDAAGAGCPVRLVEEALVELLDAVGVVALEAGGIVGGVVGDGARGDERHARHRDRLLGDLRDTRPPAAR